MKNAICVVGLTAYGILYTIGTWVQISNRDLGMSILFCAGPVFLAGMFFGRWTAKKDREMEIMREICSRSA